MRIGRARLDELSAADRATIRRWYRTLRIAIYAPQSSEYAKDGMFQGAYGLGREEVRDLLGKIAIEVDWHIYMGSK